MCSTPSLQDTCLAFGMVVRGPVRASLFGLQLVRWGSMTLDGHGGCLSWLRYSMGASRGAGGSFGRGRLGGEQLIMGVCGPIWLYWPSAVCKGRVGGGIGQNNAPAILKRCAAYVPCRGCSPGMAGPWWHGTALYPRVTSSYMGILVAGGPFQSGRMEGHQAFLGPSLGSSCLGRSYTPRGGSNVGVGPSLFCQLVDVAGAIANV